jgi:hypothetical protein
LKAACCVSGKNDSDVGARRQRREHGSDGNSGLHCNVDYG